MANGQAFASIIQGIPVECGRTYYFEWDNRWDSNPFTFSFDYTMTAACEGSDKCENALTDGGINNNAGQVESGTYQAETTIISSGDVTNTSVVDYKATTSITLTNGFIVQTGATFSATIEAVNCPNNLQDTLAISRTNNSIVTSTISEKPQMNIFPNPILNRATIEYDLTKTTNINLVLYNANGQAVRVLLDNAIQEKGQYSLALDANNLLEGVYYINLYTKENNLTKKMMIVR